MRLKLLVCIMLAVVFAFAGNVFAGSTTTKLELYKPAVGEVNWGEEVNENFDTIDTTLGTEHTIDGTHGTVNADTIGVVHTVPSGVELYVGGDVGISGNLTVAAVTSDLTISGTGVGIYNANMPTGSSQAIAGAAAGQFWSDSGDSYTIKLGQ